MQILRREGGHPIDAELRTLHVKDLLEIEAQWSPARAVIKRQLQDRRVPYAKRPQSVHWDWRRKSPELKLLESTAFGLALENKWQGVMLTKTASMTSQMEETKDKPIVYVDFLEVAPWNWTIPPLGREGRYCAVGSVLLRRAIEQSKEEGFHGRVGLHSLRQAEEFYEKVGMTRLWRDSRKDDLFYFEFTARNAEKFRVAGRQSR